MVSLELAKDSSLPILSKSSSTQEEPKLSFSDLLKGITLKKDDGVIQNGSITTPQSSELTEVPQNINSSKLLSKESFSLSSKLDSFDKSSVNTVGDSNISNLNSQDEDIKTFLGLNLKTDSKVTDTEVKLLIADAKEYLKGKITQSEAYKQNNPLNTEKSEIQELPKTLKGMVELAKKFDVDVSKITLEDIKGAKEVSVSSSTSKTNQKNTDFKATISTQEILKNSDEFNSDTQNTTLKKEKPLEMILKMSNPKESVENSKEPKLESAVSSKDIKVENKKENIENPKVPKIENTKESAVTSKDIKVETKKENIESTKENLVSSKDITVETKKEKIENTKESAVTSKDIKAETKKENIENQKESKTESTVTKKENKESLNEPKIESSKESVVNSKDLKTHKESFEKSIINSSNEPKTQNTKHTTQQFVEIKQSSSAGVLPTTKLEDKTQKSKADDTLASLLRGDKVLKNDTGLTADFSVASAKVIAPKMSSENPIASLENIVDSASLTEKTESSDVVKLDGINSSKVDDLDVKINEAKQMVKYLSQDVKSAIDDYKSPFTRIKLQLNPQELGKVEITMVQRGDNLHVNIGSNSSAISTLSMNINELKMQLSNNGINNATLNFNNTQNSDSNSSSSFGQQSNHQEQQKAQDEYSYFEKEETNEETLSSLEIVVPNYA